MTDPFRDDYSYLTELPVELKERRADAARRRRRRRRLTVVAVLAVVVATAAIALVALGVGGLDFELPGLIAAPRAVGAP